MLHLIFICTMVCFFYLISVNLPWTMIYMCINSYTHTKINLYILWRPHALTWYCCACFTINCESLCLPKGWPEYFSFCQMCLPQVERYYGQLKIYSEKLSFLYRSLSQGYQYWTKHWGRFKVHRLKELSNSRKKNGPFCITVNLTTTCCKTTERKSLKHFWL